MADGLAPATGFADAQPRAARSVFPTLAAGALAQARSSGLGRAALLGLVLGYLALVLLAPLAMLLWQLCAVGLPRVLDSLLEPAAIAALRMSLELAIIAALVNAVAGTLGALAITRQRFLGRALLGALADLPLAVSPVMIGLAFTLLLGREGLLAPLLDALGVKVLFAFPGLVIATLFVTLPFTLREVAYVLEMVGTSEEEAAATLGASQFQVFWRITLPNLRLGLGYGVLMTVARSLGEFGAVLVLGGSISGETQTATTFIHDALEERDPAAATGMAISLALISSALWLVLERVKTASDRNARRVAAEAAEAR